MGFAGSVVSQCCAPGPRRARECAGWTRRRCRRGPRGQQRRRLGWPAPRSRGRPRCPPARPSRMPRRPRRRRCRQRGIPRAPGSCLPRCVTGPSLGGSAPASAMTRWSPDSGAATAIAAAAAEGRGGGAAPGLPPAAAAPAGGAELAPLGAASAVAPRRLPPPPPPPAPPASRAAIALSSSLLPPSRPSLFFRQRIPPFHESAHPPHGSRSLIYSSERVTGGCRRPGSSEHTPRAQLANTQGPMARASGERCVRSS